MSKITEILKTMDYGVAPEGNEHVVTWLEGHQHAFKHFIDGQFAASVDGAQFEVLSPATGEQLAMVAQGGKSEVDAAVAAARRAYPAWSALPGNARARYLYALARLLQKRERFFSVLESMNNGKPIRESRDIDIPLAARHLYHHAGWADLIETEYAGYTSVGVCGQIIPWNFPLLMLACKIAPALAAGNTVVLKPAEYTPLTALAFAELCQEAGLPPGVVNIVTGDGQTGALIVEHSDVDKIAFTGSTEVGRAIRVATAGTGKKLSLELGGKSPFIVFDDADLDSAVEGVVDAIWFNQGQVCCASSRLLVQESVAHRFHEKLKARASKLRVGDPLDKSTDVGAIVSAVQLKCIESLVAKGRAEGGECWQPEHALPSRGFFFPPTLFTGIAPAATIAQEEIFGPVLVSTTFRTHDEALTLANNSRYGLAASIWSENINVALDAASRVKAGVVWINSTNLFDAAAGFGGYRESGFGREGGREGLYEYLKLRVATEKTSDITSLASPAPVVAPVAANNATTGSPILDHTAKLYIGGKQTRPDGGNSYTIFWATGKPLGQVGLGNRKDIRNAVEAAHAASGWSGYTAHNRAQVLFFLAENLEQRGNEFAQRLHALLGGSLAQSKTEVAQSVSRIMYYAAYADKYDGAVHPTRTRNVTLAMPEPHGVMGIVCPSEAPLLSMISLLMPVIAMGNRAVVVPSTTCALIATDFYQLLETSDVPSGVINIVTGERDVLAKTMAEHDDINALWYCGSAEGSAMVERASSGNLKPTWVNLHSRDWRSAANQGREFLQKATQIKNIWVPYGE